jgi:hypothetical protein
MIAKLAPVLERYLGEPGHSFSLSVFCDLRSGRDNQLSAETHSTERAAGRAMASGTCNRKEPSLKEAARA